jgi:hypothetical protein
MMNRFIFRSVAMLFLVLAVACGGDSPTGPGDTTPNLRGNYSFSANIGGDIFNGPVAITQQNGGAFSGTYTESGGSYPVSGSINGTSVTFVINGPGITINHNGNYSNGNVVGNYVATINGSAATVQGSFTLTRVQ